MATVLQNALREQQEEQANRRRGGSAPILNDENGLLG
jgi:hypothetical protein